MNNVYEMLYQMKGMPRGFFYGKSLTMLKAFINGYIAREREINEYYEDIFSDFDEFTRRYYNIEYDGHSWLENILSFTQSEDEAFDNFYKLFDKYLKECKTPEEIYPINIATIDYIYIPFKEIHYGDHGNPIIANPHEHDIKWISIDNDNEYNDNYYFDVLFLPKDELTHPYKFKSCHCSFDDIGEFINYIARGGELEFIFNSNKFSITHPENRLCLTQVGVGLSTVFLNSLNELLEHEIYHNKVKEIVTHIEPSFRAF